MAISAARRVVLADNDIIHKLACCGMLRDLLQWLGSPPTEVWVLPSMRHILLRKLKTDTAALAELKCFLLHVSDLPAADIDVLNSFPIEMDVGERQLLAVLLTTPEAAHLVTGDKRALRLIGKICATVPTLNQRLYQTQVDCLESIMLALIDKFGFATINGKASCGLHSDTVLQASFGAKKKEVDAKQALTFYLNDICKDAPFLRRVNST